MFVPFSGLQAIDLFSSPLGSSCSEKQPKDARSSSTHWTPRTATDIQHAATKSTSQSSSRYYKSKPKWQASLSRFFRSSPQDKHQNRNDTKLEAYDDVEMQGNEKIDNKEKATQRLSRMSSLKIPRSRTKSSIADHEKEKKTYEKSSMTTSSSTKIFTPNIGMSSTLKKRNRPQSRRESSLSTLLSLRDHHSTRVPSATSTAAEIPSFEPRISPPTPTQTFAEPSNQAVRRRSTIKDWKKKTDRLSLSLSLSVLAPSARLSAYGPSPHCKSTFEWDRISLDEETAPKQPVYNHPKTVTRSATERKNPVVVGKPRNDQPSSRSMRSKTELASRSTSRSRHESSIDVTGDGEFTSLMEVANGNTKRTGGVEALELI
ncbi:hypothetical protein DTO063F5_6899 [Paecilomyces variotii]|nr:hypothetical protein DTO063F5_6899 [Paecilomyces variotii]